MCRKLICLDFFVLVLGLLLSSAANAADPGLVGWWKFEESGGTLYDSSDNHNDGIYTGILYQQPGKEGHALGFDGVDDTIVVGSTNRPSNMFSFGGWLKTSALHELDPESTSGTRGVNGQKFAFYGRNGGSNAESGLSVGRNGISVYEHGSGYLPATAVYVADIGIDWNHVMVVYSNKQPTIFLNGEAVHTGLQSPRPQVLAPVYFGGYTYGYFEGTMDEVKIYSRALTQKDIEIMLGGYGTALDPVPKDLATGVPPYVILGWTPGKYADKHDVYFGDSFADVNTATSLDPMGQVYRGRQDANSYEVEGRLNYGQTYFWRIDEINAPPNSNVVFKGDIWSFTVEPYASIIENITATASSENRADESANNTIDGSGLDDNNQHSSENTTMWLSSAFDSGMGWIQYEFDKVYKMYQMWVWNYNSTVEAIVGFGIREATIEYSVDGTNWSVLGTTHEFGRGTGLPGYAHNTTLDLGGVAAKYVKITANSNWGGIVKQYGLSEVRFFSIPVLARDPSPVSGATDVDVDVTLSFRAGREAARHDVYLSTDEQAVIDGTAPAKSVTAPSYTSSLALASTYYWRIDEVNDAEIPTTWQGDIWSLSTQEYLVVDDFESYNDIEAGEEGSNLVYETWADGYASPTTNGSTIGYTEVFQPSMQKTRFFDGKQSVPLFYNNTAASISEVTANVATLRAGQDWSKYGIKGLTLRFYGDPNNVPQQMYAKVNGAKVIYDGDAENLRLKTWQMWYIDLASLGVNLSNVTALTIGLERIGAVGGQGMVLLDAIRLYSYDRQLITPADPGTAGLQAQYQFEGNANDSSGKGRNGTAMGGPLFVAGKVGQAISLDGTEDYVTITGYKGILADASGVQQPFTIAAWVKTTDSGDQTIASWGTNTNMLRVDFRLFEGRLRVEHGAGNVQGDTTLNDDNWHHVALTMIQGATVSYPDVTLWLDGRDDTNASTDPDAFSITAGVDMAIGYRATAAARYFLGAIDDVRLYDRALSPGEVAGLAGLTVPFDKSF